MKKHWKEITVLFLGVMVLLLMGCAVQQAPKAQEQELTVGVVQKEIKVGMNQADVAVALGSPNIVTKDSEGKETWIYDKIGTEASYSTSGGGATIIIAGFSKQTGSSRSSQKTLTVVIKFDKQNNVDSFTYHSSKF